MCLLRLNKTCGGLRNLYGRRPARSLVALSRPGEIETLKSCRRVKRTAAKLTQRGIEMLLTVIMVPISISFAFRARHGFPPLTENSRQKPQAVNEPSSHVEIE